MLKIKHDKFLTVCGDQNIRLFSIYKSQAIFEYNSNIEGYFSFDKK